MAISHRAPAVAPRWSAAWRLRPRGAGDAPSLLATLDRGLKEIAIHDSWSLAALGSELGAF